MTRSHCNFTFPLLGTPGSPCRIGSPLFLIAVLLLSTGAGLSPASAEPETTPPTADTQTAADSDAAAATADPDDPSASPAGPVDPDLVVPAGFDVITVTAEKRSSSLQDTPIAITALTGAELSDRGIYDVEALATQVPNFHYGEVFGLSRITIRGISVQGFNDPATAFHIDGLYQNNATAASALTFYDLQQVEVLRGPQGTLWGRNSTAGSINVATRQPVHEFELFGDVLYGSYSQTFARGVVNIPIVQDTVASRVSFYVDKRDGYQDNLFIPGKSQDANDADNWGIRPQVLFDITEDLAVTVRGGYNHQGGVGWGNKVVGDYPPTDGNPFGLYLLANSAPYIFVGPYNSVVAPGPGRVQPNPSNPRKVRSDANQFQDVSTWDVNGTVNWDFYDVPMLGNVTFNAVAGYKEERRTARFDVDLTEQDMFVSNIAARTRDRVLDAHLRNSGDTDTDWLIGFFLLDADGTLDIGLPGDGGLANIYTGPTGFVCLSDPNCLFAGAFPVGPFFTPDQVISLSGTFVGGANESLSLASYAHVKHKFFEGVFNVGFGLRYNYDSKTGERRSGQVLASLEPLVTNSCVQPGYDVRITDRWDGLTGDLKAELFPAEGHMLYGSIARGYKPGAINGDSITTNCADPSVPVPSAKEESIWAFEAGSKNLFFDDRLVANLTGFYYIYDDLQVLEQANQVTVTQNAHEARIWGVEFEGILMPIDGLTLTAIYGYLNAYYEDYIGFDYAVGEFANFSGNRMIRAPKHTATLSVDYIYYLGNYGSLTSRIQYYISDDVYFSAANRAEDLQPAYEVLEVRLRWDAPTEDFFVEGFVENLTDEDIRSTRAIGLSLLGRPRTAAFEPPRTWGVRVGGMF